MMIQSLAMGRYGSYVWSAYGVSALLLVATIALTWRAYVRAVAELRRLERDDEASSP